MTQGTQQATQTILATEEQWKPIDTTALQRAGELNVQERARKERERMEREAQAQSALAEATKGITLTGATGVSKKINEFYKDVAEGKIDVRSSEHTRRLMEIQGIANQWKEFNNQYSPLVGILQNEEIVVTRVDDNGNLIKANKEVVDEYIDAATNGDIEKVREYALQMQGLEKVGYGSKEQQVVLNNLAKNLQDIRKNVVDGTISVEDANRYGFAKSVVNRAIDENELQSVIEQVYQASGDDIKRAIVISKGSATEDDAKKWIRTQLQGDSREEKVLTDRVAVATARESAKRTAKDKSEKGYVISDAGSTNELRKLESAFMVGDLGFNVKKNVEYQELGMVVPDKITRITLKAGDKTRIGGLVGAGRTGEGYMIIKLQEETASRREGFYDEESGRSESKSVKVPQVKEYIVSIDDAAAKSALLAFGLSKEEFESKFNIPAKQGASKEQKPSKSPDFSKMTDEEIANYYLGQ